ncbi:MAG: hypothetical protein RBS19_08380 [Bacteroidales bacterium]|nr:hypothetical protein [Bacteroidales bacterium]
MAHIKCNFNLFILLLISACFVSCNHNKPSKYGVRFENKKTQSQKSQFVRFLDELNFGDFEHADKRGKISHLDDCLYISNDKLLLPDTITGVFKIKNIIEKKNNYQNVKNKIVKKNIFFIDLEFCDSLIKHPQNIRLISVPNSSANIGKTINIGDKYELVLYSFFKHDCCTSLYEGNYITSISNHHYFLSFAFTNIWIVSVNFCSYNFFESPNLDGLYYIPLEKVKHK